MASATTQKLQNSANGLSNSKNKDAKLSSSSTKNTMSHSPTKPSNGNTQKLNPIKKEPIQNSSIKRKSRTLPSSDEESDDEQTLAKKVTLPKTNINSDTLTPPADIKVEPKATPTKSPQTSANVKSEPSTPVLKTEATPSKPDKKETKPQISTPKRKSNATESDNHDDTIPLVKKAKTSTPSKPISTSIKKESPSSAKNSVTSTTSKTKSSRTASPVSAKSKKSPVKTETKFSSSSSEAKPNTSGKRKKKEEEEIWRWWEDEPYTDGVKWKTLQHNGPLFPEPYEPLPKHVKFFYNGTEVRLNPDAEEIMTFYARMLDHDYTSKAVFNKNFMKDWHKAMKSSERELIKDIRKCDFKQVAAYFKEESEKKKAMTKEEKKEKKEENERIRQVYGFCMWDNHRQPVGNYKIEPPGLFRGRGEHPKMGCVKARIVPEDVIINIGREAKIPKPPEGHKWKEVRHDNKVSWLVTWTENIRGNNKYIMLNASSRVKGERDWQKYEKARKLHRVIDKIRENYQNDWKHKEMRIRQRAVALYFIDKLALRVGNEKDEDEADTVGCCSLRVEHIQLHDRFEGVGEHVVEFDFLGKDSIRYNKKVSVEPRVYKNLKLCMENKEKNDELFDRLTTTSLNQYLSELMDGLTAKVFRTYNASKTLQEQLEKLTEPRADVNEKIISYNRANREVALLCNHQRSVPKNFEKSMEALKTKIDAKKDEVSDIKNELKQAKAEHKSSRSQTSQKKVEQTEKKLQRAEEALKKLEGQALDRNENKDVALGTSKLNYLDPRISVAWCKKWKVPIEKIYSKTQRDKFRWAIDMATADYHFYNYEGEIVLRQVDESNNNEDGDDEDEEQDQNSNDD